MLAFACNAVQAQAISGNTLYGWLMDTDQELWASMYIRGFIEGQPTGLPLYIVLAEKPYPVTLVCAPENATVKQASDVVRRALAIKPETRHEAAPTLIRAAFFEAGWKCKN